MHLHWVPTSSRFHMHNQRTRMFHFFLKLIWGEKKEVLRVNCSSYFVRYFLGGKIGVPWPLLISKFLRVIEPYLGSLPVKGVSRLQPPNHRVSDVRSVCVSHRHTTTFFFEYCHRNTQCDGNAPTESRMCVREAQCRYQTTEATSKC